MRWNVLRGDIKARLYCTSGHLFAAWETPHALLTYPCSSCQHHRKFFSEARKINVVGMKKIIQFTIQMSYCTYLSHVAVDTKQSISSPAKQGIKDDLNLDYWHCIFSQKTSSGWVVKALTLQFYGNKHKPKQNTIFFWISITIKNQTEENKRRWNEGSIKPFLNQNFFTRPNTIIHLSSYVDNTAAASDYISWRTDPKIVLEFDKGILHLKVEPIEPEVLLIKLTNVT